MRGPEGKLQDKFVKYLKSKKILYKKNEVGRYFVGSGWPDFNLFPGKGRCRFAEVKAPGGQLSPLQEHKRAELEAAGYQYDVIRSEADFPKF